MEINNLNKTLTEIFSSKYIVPLYQRNFAWSDDEISQLIQDLYESFRKDKGGNYFIGSLVVLRRRNGDFEVIDGQQRLTVISLISKVLDVDFLAEPKLYYDSRPEVEAFFSSFYKSQSTTDVTFDYKVSHLIHAVDVIKRSIINPDEEIQKSILTIDNLDEFKNFFSKNVILVRVEIPDNTDVANYFEIMNNRGEQLQKHEILKAKIMDKIKNENGTHNLEIQKIFSQIWDACSQMDFPIQTKFSRELRSKYFGENYDKLEINIKSTIEEVSIKNEQSRDAFFTIEKILANPISEIDKINPIEDIEDEGEDSSIIDFPNFLMHILKIKYNTHYKEKVASNSTESDIPLNEKDLITVFNEIEENIDPIDFIESLLYYKTAFDRFIIKASSDEKAEDNYKWSLEKPYKYTYEKTARTSLKYKSTFDDQTRIIKSLSLLQVTFRNKKYKKWLFDVLSFFKDKNLEINSKEYQAYLDKWILDYYFNNIDGSTYEDKFNAGTKTPHFLFNLIDYLLWVESVNNSNQTKFDFEFKYRNSVEHHLPQSFRNNENEKWIDKIGNLCLVSKSSNSKMNNESPVGKASVNGKYYRKNLPPKQKVMYDITNEKSDWRIVEIEDHNTEIIDLLGNAKNILKGLPK